MKKCINCGNIENNNSSLCSKCGGNLNAVTDTVAKCANCGAALSENSVFCANCGNAVNTDTGLNVCKTCGAPIKSGVAFCGSCGSPVKNEVEAPVAYNPYATSYPGSAAYGAPPAGSKRKINVILTTVLVVLLLCVTATATYLVMKNNFEDEKTTFENGENNKTEYENDKNDSGRTHSDNKNDNDDEEREERDDKKPKEKVYECRTGNVTWTEARDYANNEGGTLICINSVAEFKKACELADSYNLKVFWAGARIYSSYEDWDLVRWLDGSTMNYTPWYDGEPSYYDENTGETEMYLMVFKVGQDWYFNDAPNDVTRFHKDKIGYIVEKEK